MNNLIYYPSFEVRNKNWLKFALLYLQNIHMIIPESGRGHLSDEFWRIRDSTNLFKFHEPDMDEGYSATVDAVETFEGILRNPELYSRKFGITSRTETIRDKWRDTRNHRFEIFEEKYSYEFVRFCRDNRIGQEAGYGMLIPHELGLIYMSLLAKAIGDKNGLSPITDLKKYDYLSNLARESVDDSDAITLAQSVVNVKLPANIDQLSMQDILAFRQRQDFPSMLDAFQRAINDFHTNVESGSLTREFLRNHEQPIKDYYKFLTPLAAKLSSYALSVFLVISNPEWTIPAILKDVVLPVIPIISGNQIKVKEQWRNLHTNTSVRRYLAGVRGLGGKNGLIDHFGPILTDKANDLMI